jgi:predicted  nucleic acid-binding Zn-ribbon protein
MTQMSDLNGTSVNGAPVNGVPGDDDEALQKEYERLQRELATARDRVVAAQQRIAARDAEIQIALRKELHLAQDELSELGRRHEAALAALREETDAEVTRLLSAHPEPAQVTHGE